MPNGVRQLWPLIFGSSKNADAKPAAVPTEVKHV
jgi:hypothetical protein